MRVFIASSTEGLDVANAVHDHLRAHDEIEPKVWTEETFALSKTYIESLEKELTIADLAVIVLTGDDKLESRAVRSEVPRDNVLFELGLFMGKMGRDRCFFIHEKDKPPKIPSDLLGMEPATFTLGTEGHFEALRGACAKIAAQVKSLGERSRQSSAQLLKIQIQRQFCASIAGAWWQYFLSDETEQLAFFQIRVDEATLSLEMWGEAYDDKGTLLARWKTLATKVHPEERKVFYYWEGDRPREYVADSFSGFGRLIFFEAPERIDRGDGRFSDVQMGMHQRTIWKACKLHRVEQITDIEIMTSGSESQQKSVVQRVLREW